MSEQPHVDKTARLALIAVFNLGAAFFFTAHERMKKEELLVEYIAEQLNLNVDLHQKVSVLEKALATAKSGTNTSVKAPSPAAASPTATPASSSAQSAQ